MDKLNTMQTAATKVNSIPVLFLVDQLFKTCKSHGTEPQMGYRVRRKCGLNNCLMGPKFGKFTPEGIDGEDQEE